MVDCLQRRQAESSPKKYASVAQRRISGNGMNGENGLSCALPERRGPGYVRITCFPMASPPTNERMHW